QDGVPAVTFGRPQRVYAIRLPALQRAGGPTVRDVTLAWEGRERGAVRGAVPTLPADGAQDGTVWVNDVIDGFRIEADDLDRLRGARLVVLVPPRQRVARWPAPTTAGRPARLLSPPACAYW